ncbi:MAG: phage integrase N-terminal domain-containing protein [Pseudomonadota bacterium]
MKDLNYQLKNLCRNNRDGGYSTQASRSRLLDLMANQLHELGYRRMRASSLRPKHVQALVSLWKEQDVSIGTTKNRLSALRWWAEKVNKRSVVARSNDAYGIGSRQFVSNESKAKFLNQERLVKITDPYVRMSVRLQEAFGLRREESIKFRPDYAIRENEIVLKGSWTKGGRPRAIPITSDAQRELLQDAKALAGSGAVIPADRRYVDQLHRYERQTAKAGLTKLHGLRHGYAQRRYRDLTGRDAPAAGGKCCKEFTAQEKAADREARLQISTELGHSREQITATYLGR